MKCWCVTMIGAGLSILAMPAQAQEREPVQARVKLNDLNLNTPAGQRTANDRIETAAREACGSDGSGGLRASADHRRCRNEVLTSGASSVSLEQSRQRAEQQRLVEQRARNLRTAARRAPVAKARYRHCYWSKRYHKRVCVWRRR